MKRTLLMVEFRQEEFNQKNFTKLIGFWSTLASGVEEKLGSLDDRHSLLWYVNPDNQESITMEVELCQKVRVPTALEPAIGISSEARDKTYVYARVFDAGKLSLNLEGELSGARVGLYFEDNVCVAIEKISKLLATQLM